MERCQLQNSQQPLIFISLIYFYTSVWKKPLLVKCSYCYFAFKICSFESKINHTVTYGELCLLSIKTTNLISVSHQNSRCYQIHKSPPSQNSVNKRWLGEMEFMDCQSSLAHLHKLLSCGSVCMCCMLIGMT